MPKSKKEDEVLSAFAVYATKRKNAARVVSLSNLQKVQKRQAQKVRKENRQQTRSVIGKTRSGRAKKTTVASLPVIAKRKKPIRKPRTTTRNKRNEFFVNSKSSLESNSNSANTSSTTTTSRFPAILDSDCKLMRDDSENPLITSRSMFNWLIHPMKCEDFFRENWEKTPVHIKRSFPNYYKVLMSTPILDKVLRESHILFTKNIDITSYENGVRETHNPSGRALPSVVWDYYLNGCSVRMLNPQTYIPKLHALNATLQELFGCFVGANSYLTPANSQGFAPHYDDIEAFILQIEGKKRWRLYKPRDKNEYLARFSSKNFDQSEIGEPILDTLVNAGDVLYFPRGTIHQGETLEDAHSLHVTLSVYQKNSWGDFLEKLLPNALRTATENDIEFREGLPLDYLSHSGLVHRSETETETETEIEISRKELFKKKVKSLCEKLIEYIDVDKAADSMAKNHLHDFLPPSLSEAEQECSVARDGERMTANGVVKNRVEIEPDTRIRLLRSHCTRLIEEDNALRIYYSTENSKEYREYEAQFLEIAPEFAPAVQELILRYPKFVRVEDLPIDGEDNKIQIVKDLWEKCIVITDNPLCVIE